MTSRRRAFDSVRFSYRDNESLISEEDCTTVSVDVDYPPGTKVKVQYGRARNSKPYDAKVVDVKLRDDQTIVYSVHYNGWNQRFDDV